MRVLPYRTSEDRIEGVIITFVDITARRQAEDRLQHSVESLEVRVRERTQALETANASLDLQLRERQAAQDRVRRLMHRLITVQEDERRRVARDLHDHLGQQMTGLRLEIEALGAGHPVGDDLRTRIEGVQRQVDRLDRDVDFLIWQLRPAALEGVGLRAALGRYVSEWSTNYDTPAEFQATGVGDERLDPQVETSIYRVLQEALNNVQKHAKATRVGVILERRGDDLVLVVEDNGRGFDASAFEATPHDGHQMGVVGMRERAALAGGTVDIETGVDSGTTVFMRVPGAAGTGR